MKALTIKELIDQLQALVATGQVDKDAWVIIEGCDCNGYVDGVRVEATFKPEVSEYDDDCMFVAAHEAPGPAAFLKRMGQK